MNTVSEFRSSVVAVWQKRSDAVVEYSRDIGILVVSICIPKMKCNCVDLTVAGLMRVSFFFSLWKYYFAFCLLLNVLQLSSKSRMIFQLMQFWHVTDWNLLHKTSAGGCLNSWNSAQVIVGAVTRLQPLQAGRGEAQPSAEFPGSKPGVLLRMEGAVHELGVVGRRSWDLQNVFSLYWFQTWYCSPVHIAC